MGLFKKETCCLCGEKVGLLDKKCLDGKICKECKGKLSVWFDDYKNVNTDLLKIQLSQKELEETRLASFNFSKIFGEFGVILIDEKQEVFTAFPDTSSGLFGNQREVKSIDDVKDLRPDIIHFEEVEDFDIDITETMREEKQTVNGQQESYNPPHYTYMYMFTLRMKIKNHPYINSVYIQLNNGAVQVKNVGPRLWSNPGRRLAAHLLNLPRLIVEDQEAVYDNESLLHTLFRSEYEMPDYSYGFKCSNENWKDILKYQYYLAMAREIQDIITRNQGV